jgi:hypothetical protein
MYLPFSDFILGLSDLTGELMRFSVTSVATGRDKGRAQPVCDFVRSVKAGENASTHSSGLNNVVLDFEGLTPYIRDLPKKQWVTGQSLRKIEEGKCSLEETRHK